MRKLFQQSPRFKSTFQLENGRRIRGLIDEPTNRQPPAYQFLHPRRILTVDPKTNVAVGNIIRTVSNKRYLLLENGDDVMGSRHISTSFRLVQMTNSLPWSETVMEKDFLTGLDRNSSENIIGNIWCNIEPLRDDFDRALKARDQRFRIVTNADLKAGDTVGTMKVDKLSNILGILVAEAQ